MAYSAVDVWDISALQGVEITTMRRAVRTPVDGGMVQRRQTQSSESEFGQAALRQFRVMVTDGSKGDFNKIMALWKNTTGGSQGINYTHTNTAYSGTENLIVRMVVAPLSVRQLSHGQYAFTVVLEEMLHAPG